MSVDKLFIKAQDSGIRTLTGLRGVIHHKMKIRDIVKIFLIVSWFIILYGRLFML